MEQILELRARVTGVAQYDLSKPILPAGLDTGRVFITLVPVRESDEPTEDPSGEDSSNPRRPHHFLAPSIFEPPNPMVIYMNENEYTTLGNPSVGEELRLTIGRWENDLPET